MLLCHDGSYYIGVTSEIDVRVAEHAQGVDPRCYTFRRRPVKLVHAEVFSRPDEAIRAEKTAEGLVACEERSPCARRLGGDAAAGEIPSRGIAAWHDRSPFDKLRVTSGSG